MNLTKLKVHFKLYWIRILLAIFAFPLLIILIALLVFGIHTFFNIESFYRKMTLAGMPFQIYLTIFSALVFASIYMGFHYYFFFGGGISKLGQKKVKPQDVNVKWSDVIGMGNIKKEVWEVIRLIKDHAQVQKVGGKIIKGVLMIGPPGCGKTYLAKAIATETGLPFISAAGSEFQGIFMGMGSSRIKTLFRQGRALSELHGGCIIFIDEIDSIARPRVGGDSGFGAGMDHNATVNQLLTELDGLSTGKENIVVIAATNVVESDLDPALMRAGRFDRKIYVGLPGLKEREDIFKFYLEKISYDKEKVDMNKLARLTVGDSPADIFNIVREASLIAVRNQKSLVGMSELNEARERIALGIKMPLSLSQKDKELIACHEAGHTIVAYLMVPTQDVFKASIIPRRDMGGVTWIVEKEERLSMDKDEVLEYIKIWLGGYVAEKIQFGITSSGVESDLRRANKLAEYMVSQWGMGTSGLASISEHPWASQDVVQRDKEDIINKCLTEVNELLRHEKNLLDELSKELLSKEELDYDQLDEIFHRFGKTRISLLPKQEELKPKDGIRWNDVIGMDEAKEEAAEIVSLIKDRVALKMIGGQIIRGLLMFGPPGCGKTYLASAMANETGIPFIAKSGSEFVEMYVGVGASRIRHLFQEAREQAMAKGGCIIFIDEIDALCAKREEAGSGGNREYNQTLNQFLVEMDGLKEKGAQYNIVVIGATNVQEAFLDAAILRPGRFDRKIYVDLPSFDDRKKIFAYYLNKVKYDAGEIDVEKFAGITQGWSPADISNLIREGALLAVRNKKEAIGIKEIDEARERIQLGLKQRIKQTKEELRSTAYHEAGHCIANYFFTKKTFPFKLSIIPRRGTLGVAWYATKGDTVSGTQLDLLAQIKAALAGYVAEKLKLGVSGTGVTSDFSHAMRIAHTMVWELGMGKLGLIGNFKSLYFRSGQEQPLLSETMKAKLDEEIQQILQECLKETEKLLTNESELLEHLTEELLKKEELNYSELEEIFKKYAKDNSPDHSG